MPDFKGMTSLARLNFTIHLLLSLLFIGLSFPLKTEAGYPENAWPAGIMRAALISGIPLSSISIVVKEPQGVTILSLNPDVTHKMGSAMKLLTTFVALDQLGPHFRFHTDLFANPVAGHPERWKMALRGGGDSGFQYADLMALLRQAQDEGVRRLDGNIIVDRRRFNIEKQLTSGIDLNSGSLSGIRPNSLSVGYSAIELRLPRNRRGEITIDPPFKLLLPTNRFVQQHRECPKDWEEDLNLIAHAPSPKKIEAVELIGTWPENCPEGVIRRAPLSANEQLKWSVWNALRELGRNVRPEMMDGDAPSYAEVSIRYLSKPLAILVRDINKFSNNVAARTLLLNLAAESGRLPASAEDGAEIIQNWLKSRGFNFPELVIENGSGLSHKEVLSAGHLTELLNAFKKEEQFGYFLDSLPIPGEIGTLQKRFVGREDRLQWHLKTGRLDGLKVLAGYRVAPNGEIYTLVCMVEHENADQALALQEALMDWMTLK
jgi:D-alanyl-D-alanine carboxypeptidase/D-alanyl-D-alanine-endopeptidase (penicillin-binding protein 4)